MSDFATAAADVGPPRAWPVLSVLSCPACGGELEGAEGGVVCRNCASSWPEADGWLDFRPPEFVSEGDWRRRQESMEEWYDGLFANTEAAEGCYSHDYEPLTPHLAKLRGLVLDVGGGNGIARQFLHPAATYLDLDPSAKWLEEDWQTVSSSFPGLRSPLTFALGVGEQLPVRTGAADAVLSLYSINHASDPESVIREADRVLRPGGTLLVVAEDIEPRWVDFTRKGFRDGWLSTPESLRMKLASAIGRREWPVASDHVRVTESDLRSWLGPRFEVTGREWVGGYLALIASKRG